MNVEGEQNASASAPASPTTASTAAVQQALQITSFFQLERTSSTQATPATSPPAAAADLPAAAVAGTNMTAPASPHQQPVAHPVGVRTRYHTPWFITSPGGRRDQHSITGATQDTTPPTGYTPGDNIFKRSNVSPGGCYLV